MALAARNSALASAGFRSSPRPSTAPWTTWRGCRASARSSRPSRRACTPCAPPSARRSRRSWTLLTMRRRRRGSACGRRWPPPSPGSISPTATSPCSSNTSAAPCSTSTWTRTASPRRRRGCSVCGLRRRPPTARRSSGPRACAMPRGGGSCRRRWAPNAWPPSPTSSGTRSGMSLCCASPPTPPRRAPSPSSTSSPPGWSRRTGRQTSGRSRCRTGSRLARRSATLCSSMQRTRRCSRRGSPWTPWRFCAR
mmetsp:Transcript_104131/g.204239  ORF Transcript_104131/g.204239 Transcript_104131/m.204239 type:complete len:252 (+) Transcript_104131:45-800(+)